MGSCSSGVRASGTAVTIEKKGPYKLSDAQLKDEFKTSDRDPKKDDFDLIRLRLMQDGKEIDSKTSFSSLSSKALEAPAPGKYTAEIEFHTEFLPLAMVPPAVLFQCRLGRRQTGNGHSEG